MCPRIELSENVFVYKVKDDQSSEKKSDIYVAQQTYSLQLFRTAR